jgi:pyruvate-ferredoxin/flavodoxin oxidoreductase
MTRTQVTIDGNEAAAHVAYRTNEVMTIYPITPSSTMGELADAWSAAGQKNIWGSVPTVQEMQSEGGAVGAVHGALQAGALTTTFTASQGLLLMIPNMFKIAGELTSAVFHVTARAVATHALSIFGDHSDVMAVRATGWAMLFSSNVQEAMDMALIAQAATLKARVPFVHVFDGFRTSHEVRKIEMLDDADIRAMIDDADVRAHRARALTPDAPVMRGTAQNPDVFFQAREACNPYYAATPGVVQAAMDRFAQIVGRQYRLFDYDGAADAERVIIIMGSGAETVRETARALAARGAKVGVVTVRLYRPFSREHLLAALPPTVRAVAVLDRTKEPGATGEPLYQDVVTAFCEGVTDRTAPFIIMPHVIGGRYGLSSKEFTPAMVKAVYAELEKQTPKNHFSVGIHDDVTHNSLDYDPSFSIEGEDTVRAVFWGLGSDGTVGANKNTIKIIGEETDNYAQGFFIYDSKKSGSVTVSHLRFGPRPILSPYLIQQANFVAIHQFGFLDRYPVLETAAPGATALLNSPYGPDEVWDSLPCAMQAQILDKQLKLYVIDAYAVAKQTGMGVRINGIMQTCFFALSGVLPKEEAIARIKEAIKKSYGKRGEAVLQQNYAAVDETLAHLYEVRYPDAVTSARPLPPTVAPAAPEFVQKVTAEIIAGRGDSLPVSAFPVDGTFPTGTSAWEKRNIAAEVPVWDPDVCIQCGKCVLVCPHGVIRAKVVSPETLQDAPEGYKTAPAKWREFGDSRYILQVAVEDCTGCTLCVEDCPAKDKSAAGRKAINMEPQRPLREQGAREWDYFLTLPETPRHTDLIRFNNIKNVQLLQPLFEFSGACAGCGETPYIKLVSQLFGDRALIANATGCSSIYGGNLPTTPYAKNSEGRGPAWSNSLFEDNAEFGLGMRLSLNAQESYARELVTALRDRIGAELADGLLAADQSDEAQIAAQRARVAQVKAILADAVDPSGRDLLALADKLVKKSVWIVGGDGWAYDIGYGGLDHVLSSGRNVNVLVLDTEVYSNTGGQASKATARGAVAKFAAGGKAAAKKDLGRMAMAYGNVYVAAVALGASDAQTVRAFLEAEAYDGPSIIIAYSHCIAHGIDMSKGLHQQKLAVDSGSWLLYRYDPSLAAAGKNPLQLDCKEPTLPLRDYIYTETRYKMLQQSHPDVAADLLAAAQEDVRRRWRDYSEMAK